MELELEEGSKLTETQRKQRKEQKKLGHPAALNRPTSRLREGSLVLGLKGLVFLKPLSIKDQIKSFKIIKNGLPRWSRG